MRWKSVALLAGIVLSAILLSADVANAATITYSAVTTYTDASTIPPADVARIVYTGYYGSSATGPWTAGASSLPAACPSPLPTPLPAWQGTTP